LLFSGRGFLRSAAKALFGTIGWAFIIEVELRPLFQIFFYSMFKFFTGVTPAAKQRFYISNAVTV
jgi:hypothetical protein